MNTYTKRMNAKRAAMKAGISASEVKITVHKNGGEVRFGFKRKEKQPVPPATVAGKAQRAPVATVPAAPRERHNGVARPKAGGLCAAVWQWLDAHPSAKLSDVRDAAGKRGWNKNNASIELYRWRKFNDSQDVRRS